MINKNKKYKTRNNCEWKCYEIYGDVIHGAYSCDGGKTWRAENWNLDGIFLLKKESILDLIEISPYADFKIDDKVLVWDHGNVNKYKAHFAGIHEAGDPMSWANGRTSFTTDEKTEWQNCIKYEEQNDK